MKENEFVGEMLHLLKHHTLGSRGFSSKEYYSGTTGSAESPTPVKGLAVEEGKPSGFTRLREEVVRTNINPAFVNKVVSWMEQLWRLNGGTSGLSQSSKDKVFKLFEENKVEGLFPEAKKKPAPGGNGPGSEGGKGPLPPGKTEEGFFFFTWWGFKDKATVQKLNDDGLYPRNLGKASRPLYEEPSTKDPHTIDTNAKPYGESEFIYITGGTTRTEVEFYQKARVSRGNLKDYPIIALGVAIGERSLIAKLKKSHKIDFDSSFTNADAQLLYEITNKEQLRWRWTYEGQIDGDDILKDVTVKGRVVDNDKTETSDALDAINLLDPAMKDPLKADMVAALLDIKNDVGVEDGFDVTLVYKDGNGKEVRLSTTTDSHGTFGFSRIPPNSEIVVTAKMTKWVGFADKPEAITVNPWMRGSVIKLDKEKHENIIIPMRKKDKKVPEPKELIILCDAEGGIEHEDARKPLFSVKNVVQASKLKKGSLSFTAYNSPKGKDVYVLGLITKLKDVEKDVDRKNLLDPLADGPFEKAASDWNATFTITYRPGKSVEVPFDAAKKVNRTIHKASFAANLTVPAGAVGKYRVWLFLLANDVSTVNDKGKLTALFSYLDKGVFHDFNYYDILVDPSKDAKLTAPGAKPGKTPKALPPAEIDGLIKKFEDVSVKDAGAWHNADELKDAFTSFLQFAVKDVTVATKLLQYYNKISMTVPEFMQAVMWPLLEHYFDENGGSKKGKSAALNKKATSELYKTKLAKEFLVLMDAVVKTNGASLLKDKQFVGGTFSGAIGLAFSSEDSVGDVVKRLEHAKSLPSSVGFFISFLKALKEKKLG